MAGCDTIAQMLGCGGHDGVTRAALVRACLAGTAFMKLERHQFTNNPRQRLDTHTRASQKCYPRIPWKPPFPARQLRGPLGESFAALSPTDTLGNSQHFRPSAPSIADPNCGKGSRHIARPLERPSPHWEATRPAPVQLSGGPAGGATGGQDGERGRWSVQFETGRSLLSKRLPHWLHDTL